MPPSRTLDHSHVFNAVNALSADIHRLSEVNRLSTLGIEEAMRSSVDDCNLYTTTTVVAAIAELQSRVEELHDELTEQIPDVEDIENKVDDILSQVEDLPTNDNIEEALNEKVSEINDLVKAEQSLLPYRFQNMNARIDADVLVRVPRLVEKRLEPVSTKLPYPRTKGQLSQLDFKSVRKLLEWYGFDVTTLKPNFLEQHRTLLAGYLGVALLA
ncbi:hypothetical protein SCHPADRAFT_890770 [Schizopora paradoxa]|uniref:Uncharacterized protein n=1 Tax=Schizopora paradoxa TaxID=27342 RepID=A0A0H2S6K9_9AGAM|nr:hypothetical protein SCHPADRAFT_890770 [Schizopora paradoxa]